MGGQVVKAAEQALAAGNVNLVFAWIQRDDEPEIRAAFSLTQAVRKLNPEAGQLADRYFFETLVRLHHAGEAPPYTGLQPAGGDLGPGIPADKAIENGSVDALAKMFSDAAENGAKKRFQENAARQKFAKDDVAAATEYVKKYVEFVHYVEGLHEDIRRGGHEDSHDPHSVGNPATRH
jgi:hypothetical protein